MSVQVSTTVVHAAREGFLGGESTSPDGVRAPILTSWKRSKAWNVAADSLAFPFIREPNVDTVLARAARPILTDLADSLSGEAVGVVLGAADGLVLHRSRESSPVTAAFDKYGVEVGHSCAEEFVGTNGIGSVIESRQSVAIEGREHYAEPLGALSCVGVPITHPISGSLLGALDLTCLAGESRTLLSALASSTVRHIENRLLDGASVRERALLDAYQRTCRRTTKGVLAVGGDVVLLNKYVRRSLDKEDQSVLVGHAVDLLVSSIVQPLTVSLPSGRSARLVPADAGAEGTGTVVFTVAADTRKPEHVLPPAVAPRLPGVVGSSTSWRRSCAEVVRRVRGGRWVLVEGEAGVGRAHLLGAAASENLPGRGRLILSIPDYDDHRALLADVAAATDTDEFRIVLRDLDALSSEVAEELRILLDERRPNGWVGGTVGACAGEGPSPLLEVFDRVVHVTALRHRVGDLEQLIPHLLSQLTQGAGPTLAADAAAQLARYAWPGNVTQLRKILSQVVQKQRSGIVSMDKLPAECRAVTRRKLTQIEALQRDAIVASLQDNGGDKTAAAAALGISRATIYRRIREFGIT